MIFIFLGDVALLNFRRSANQLLFRREHSSKETNNEIPDCTFYSIESKYKPDAIVKLSSIMHFYLLPTPNLCVNVL